MSKVRASGFPVLLEGYAAGPRQGLENPLGVRGPELFESFFDSEIDERCSACLRTLQPFPRVVIECGVE